MCSESFPCCYKYIRAFENQDVKRNSKYSAQSAFVCGFVLKIVNMRAKIDGPTQQQSCKYININKKKVYIYIYVYEYIRIYIYIYINIYKYINFNFKIYLLKSVLKYI